MAETSRRKQIEAVSTMGWFYCALFVAFVVIGGVMINCLAQNGYTEDLFWGKIYIGSFVLGGVSAFYAFVLCSVLKADKEGRHHDVSKGIQCINCLLYGSISALGLGIAFTAVFIKESDVFEPCNNFTDSNATLIYGKEEECMENCKGLTIGHLVFLVIFFLMMLWGCSERSKKNEQLLSVEPAVQHTSQNKDPTETRAPNNTTIHKINSDSSLSTKSETSEISDQTIEENNRLQIYHVDDSPGYQNKRIPGNELYSHSHISDNQPPPLASVCGDSGTFMQRQRLPPIQNYKSITTEPKVPPPSYEDVLAGRY